MYTLLKPEIRKTGASKALKRAELVPLLVCKEEKPQHIDLLFLKKGEASEYGHYVYIKNFSRLISSDRSKHNGQIYACKCCLTIFNSCERLKQHQEACNGQRIEKPVRVHLPQLGAHILRFKDQQYTRKLDYVIYADLECILKPVSDDATKKFGEASSRLQQHVPVSYCYYVVGKENIDELKPVVYTARSPCENIMHHLMLRLQTEARKIFQKLREKRDIKKMKPLTPAEMEEFNSIRACPECATEFINEIKPCRHHCHVTGAYLKPLCNSCNLKLKVQYFVPVIFHNLRGYDGHFIVSALNVDTETLDIIPSTREKYTCLTKRVRVDDENFISLRFIDSFQFMSSSLQTLAKNLPHTLKHHLSVHINDATKVNLLCQKGHFPYTYLSDYSRLSTPHLPPIEEFYNDLKRESLSEQEYRHVQTVWSHFECQTLQDYLEVYLLSDVLLLADIFENFRLQSLTHYQLDPCHFVSTPSLSWYSMLKKTKVELELLCDIDMYLMFEQNIRGGVCHVSKRYARANNPYMLGGDDDEGAVYDPSKRTSYLMYYDQNSLYANAMSHYLPQSDFRWLPSEEISELNILTLAPDAETGYVLEVDLEYPQTIHAAHKDYPFCAEKSIPPNSKGKVAKLMCTVENKTKYVIHYLYLQCALQHGLRLTKIHRVLAFSQSPWLKPYIDLNIELRKTAKNKFETDYFKLLNNSIFGRSIMNVRKFLNAKLVLNKQQFWRAVSKVTFAKSTIFDENIALMEFYKGHLFLNIPIYVGFSILDISKQVQYNWFYTQAPLIFKNFKYSLMYTDTDSFILHLYSKKRRGDGKAAAADVYTTMLEWREKFDLSNFPKDHPCYSEENARQLNMMKDEYAGNIIVEVVALRPKMY